MSGLDAIEGPHGAFQEFMLGLEMAMPEPWAVGNAIGNFLVIGVSVMVTVAVFIAIMLVVARMKINDR